MTLQEQLSQINEAITAIEIGGQEYTFGNRNLKRPDLKTLYNRRKEIESQLQYDNACGDGIANTFVSVFDRR